MRFFNTPATFIEWFTSVTTKLPTDIRTDTQRAGDFAAHANVWVWATILEYDYDEYISNNPIDRTTDPIENINTLLKDWYGHLKLKGIELEDGQIIPTEIVVLNHLIDIHVLISMLRGNNPSLTV